MISNEPLFPVISNGTSSGSGNFQGVLAAAPSSPQEGWTYINSGDDGYYIFYCGTWQLLHTLVCSHDFFLLETGDYLLKEDGDKIELEP
jgi:hypothetical protein